MSIRRLSPKSVQQVLRGALVVAALLAVAACGPSNPSDPDPDPQPDPMPNTLPDGGDDDAGMMPVPDGGDGDGDGDGGFGPIDGGNGPDGDAGPEPVDAGGQENPPDASVADAG